MPSEPDDRDATATRFVAALGAAMAFAYYPVTMVRGTTAATSQAYGLDNQSSAFPSYVQAGSVTGEVSPVGHTAQCTGGVRRHPAGRRGRPRTGDRRACHD